MHRAGDRRALEQLRTSGLRAAGQLLVKRGAGTHKPVAGVTAQLGPVKLEAHAAADHPQALVAQPAGLFADVDAERDEGLDRARGEAVAAHLVPREPGLLEQQHVKAGLRQVVGGRGAGGTGADDYHVGVVIPDGYVLGHLIRSWVSCERLHKIFAVSLILAPYRTIRRPYPSGCLVRGLREAPDSGSG